MPASLFKKKGKKALVNVAMNLIILELLFVNPPTRSAQEQTNSCKASLLESKRVKSLSVSRNIKDSLDIGFMQDLCRI
ncbi:hypothetical protein KFK09_000382 [Dendrobium nobile]|uniref:Uncharacterized protein n=1 Tax=Dendrobium nobile TaxID=94219 RepID=A0A8T3C8E5_DENNO|nr:hypothetical protein KFK09_000382 [Dendrobium nobile]